MNGVEMIAFGPVPSRRLGNSLGINHISAKHCSYSCVYCQVGRTTHMEVARKEYYPVDQILADVERKITEYTKTGKVIDYLTFVPDGEPTLDINLGTLIDKLIPFGIPIAVISNVSLINRQDVQEELLRADWVSLKVDSVDEHIWRKINRPHHGLSLAQILDGMLSFRKIFRGELVTETMLVADLNDNELAARQLCGFLLELQPFKSYLSIPTRPPIETWATSPSPDSLNEVLKICSDRLPLMDFLFDVEVGEFSSTGNLAEDILAITAVHPLREKALKEMISTAGRTWELVYNLLAAGEISCINYRDENYYLRQSRNKAKKINN